MREKKATDSTTYFTYNHLAKKIVGTELNFKKSGIPNSEQDKELMERIAEHPDYNFEVIKPAKKKNSYKGLKRELMYDYIDCFGSDEMMEQLQKMKNDGTGFPAMKSWFLDLFPKFNVEKAKKDIQQYRLGKVKTKYKVVNLYLCTRVSAPTASASGTQRRCTTPTGSILHWCKGSFSIAAQPPHNGISALSRNELSKQFRITYNSYKIERQEATNDSLSFMLFTSASLLPSGSETSHFHILPI